MSITVYSERDLGNGYVRRRYEVTLTDSLGGTRVDVIGPFTVLPTDDGSTYEAQHLASIKQQEINSWIGEMEAGNDPAHIDLGGYFGHSTPLWNTWEECLVGSVTPFLQSDYMQDILKCDLTCSRLTKAELEAVAGKNNAVRGEQAVATTTKTELDNYIPLIDLDGNPR